MSNYKLVIEGFNNIEEVRQFANWYANQGEQFIEYFLEELKDKRIISVGTMNTESINEYNETITLTIKPR